MGHTCLSQPSAYRPPHHQRMKYPRLQGDAAGIVQAQPALWRGQSTLACRGHAVLDASARCRAHVL